MLHFDKAALQNLEKVQRLNLVNSITGIKPANLVGSVSVEGQTNLAIFSSVVHLGSNPAVLGLIVRPAGEVERHTYENIMANGFYTINHVAAEFVQQAHHTSAKFSREESEFAACGFNEVYLDAFPAPFVAESRIKIGLQLLQELPITVNGTLLLVGQVEHLYLPHESLSKEGYIDLDAQNSTGISGLNTYYTLQKIGSLPYAQPGETPQFERE